MLFGVMFDNNCHIPVPKKKKSATNEKEILRYDNGKVSLIMEVVNSQEKNLTLL